jgi:MFS transporter, DHA1 family, inner membrane transport protein
MNSTRIRFTRSEKILLALMAGINFNHLVDFMILMPLGPTLFRVFGIEAKQFGLLVSSYSFAAGLSGITTSFFVDRFDRKSALLFFFAGFTVSTVACALAPSYWSLLAARSLAGAFGGVLSSLVLSIVSDAIPYERRGTAMGVVMASFSVASVVGVPLGLELANRFSWHAPFVFLGALSFLVWVMIAFYMPGMKGHFRSKEAKRSKWDALAQVGKNPPQQWALFFMFALVMGQFTVIPYLSQSYVANAGLPESKLSYIYLFGGVCSMIAAPSLGWLADKSSKHTVFAGSVLLSVLPILLITNMTQQPVWVLILVSCSFFIVMSGRMVPAMAMVSSTATPEYRGSFMSFSSAVQNLSAALASYAGGLIVTVEAGHFVHYERAGYVAIAFSLLAFFASRRIPRGQA